LRIAWKKRWVRSLSIALVCFCTVICLCSLISWSFVWCYLCRFLRPVLFQIFFFLLFFFLSFFFSDAIG
jgi:hypothetical protein